MLNFTDINYLAVLVATIVAFGLGAVWYTALFGKSWQKEVGLNEKQLNDTNYLRTYGGSFVCMFLMMVLLASLLKGLGISGNSELMEAAKTGFLVGLFFVSASAAINYIYEFKSMKLFLINTSYQTIFLTIGSIIIALWN
jgi:hypothetical protein